MRLITRTEVALLSAFRSDPTVWLNSREAAEAAGLNPVTTKRHAARLAGLGVLTVSQVQGGYRYRLHPTPSEAAREYLAAWEAARDSFGVPAPTA